MLGDFSLTRLDTMTRRRRLLLIASLPLAIAMIIGVLAMLAAREGVTIAKYQRIKEGMAKSEVEQILGRPCDKVAEGLEIWSFWEEVQGKELFFRVNVRFIDGRVHNAILANSIPAKTTSLERILRVFHLD